MSSIAGISDSTLEAGITMILSNDKYQDRFEATQQFLGTLVANQMVHRQAKRNAGDDRNVSAADGNGKPQAKPKGKKLKIEARYYSAEEWKKLTSEERSKVIELKKQQGYEAKKGQGKRKASASESKKDKDVVADASEGEDYQDNAPAALF